MIFVERGRLIRKDQQFAIRPPGKSERSLRRRPKHGRTTELTVAENEVVAPLPVVRRKGDGCGDAAGRTFNQTGLTFRRRRQLQQANSADKNSG